VSSSQLQAHPLPILWHRRRINKPTPHKPTTSEKDLSPFPKSWSVNYSGARADDVVEQVNLALDESADEHMMSDLKNSKTDDSSAYSTISQEQRHKQVTQRDEEGNCRKHPYVKLARRKVPSNENYGGKMTGEEWVVTLDQCPDCEKEYTQQSKSRYQQKSVTPQPHHWDPLTSSCTSQNRRITYEPFPATLTFIESHPHLDEGTPALQIRTDAVPIDQTMHPSCAAILGGDDDVPWQWSTPDGALDFLIPCDASGTISLGSDIIEMNNNTSYGTARQMCKAQYQIMERIIPLTSIDHVSRGGDAWDVLRQSLGENDLGCRCDVKIHGYADRLLRFDVVNFDIPSSETYGAVSRKTSEKLKYSFADVDFFRSSISHIVKSSDDTAFDSYTTATVHDTLKGGRCTSDNVIAKLNSIVLYYREKRETGVIGWKNFFSTWIEECLSLGESSTGKGSIC
jgi:hypothetical protein